MLTSKEIDDFVRSEQCQTKAAEQAFMVLAGRGLSLREWENVKDEKIKEVIHLFSMMTASMSHDHIDSMKKIADLKAENERLRKTLEMMK